MRSISHAYGLGGTLGVALLLGSVSSAKAHLSFERGGTHLSRYGDDEIKDGPCGRDGGTRGTNVYTYEPGQTITITVAEFVPHPGYFRIAFDQDGDDDFVEPRSIKPVDPSRACPYDGNDKCGESDFYNSPAVLPGMDNLNPHLAGDAQDTYTWEVTLPDVECDNCTLQVIQVMEDTIHGPYAPKGSADEIFYVEDIYHSCIDLVLKRGATPGDNPPPPVSDGSTGGDDGSAGGADGASGDGSAADGSASDGSASDGSADGPAGDGAAAGGTPEADSGGGCNVAAGPAAAPFALFGALGLLVARRRRR